MNSSNPVKSCKIIQSVKAVTRRISVNTLMSLIIFIMLLYVLILCLYNPMFDFLYSVNAKAILACYVTMWRQRVSKGNPFMVYYKTQGRIQEFFKEGGRNF